MMTINKYPHHTDKHFALNQDCSLYDISKFDGVTIEVDPYKYLISCPLQKNVARNSVTIPTMSHNIKDGYQLRVTR
jgi:hypothetical protein